MKRFFVRLFSCFILDKNKRREFRAQHDSVVAQDLELQSLKKQIRDLKNLIYEISVWTGNHLCEKSALEIGLLKSESEHIQNIEKLKFGLDKEALGNIDNILRRINFGNYPQTMLPTEIYSEDEIKVWRAAKEMAQKIQKIDNFYQYNKYRLPINYFEPAIFLHKHGLNKLKTLKDIGDKVIIDAGGFILDSALVFRDYTENRIISFEPTKKTYELGLKTINLNNLQNITYENVALGDKNETNSIYICDECPGANGLLHSQGRTPQVCQTVTLDSYVEKHNLSVGLIKTDVEGFEPNLLKGALNTIREQKPILLISIYHNYNDFYKIKPYIESLNLGYKFNFFKGVDDGYCLDIMLMAEVY